MSDYIDIKETFTVEDVIEWAQNALTDWEELGIVEQMRHGEDYADWFQGLLKDFIDAYNNKRYCLSL